MRVADGRRQDSLLLIVETSAHARGSQVLQLFGVKLPESSRTYLSLESTSISLIGCLASKSRGKGLCELLCWFSRS